MKGRRKNGNSRDLAVLSVKVNKDVKARFVALCEQYELSTGEAVEALLVEFMAITEAI